MSWLSNMFGGGHTRNPADSANKYLSQIPSTMQQYFQPYINQGQQAGSQLTDQYNQMTQDPGAFMAQMGQGYQQSPGYQFKLQQALNAGNNAAAAGGMLGTGVNQQQNMQLANDIGGQDFNDYMERILKMFTQGQAGQQSMQQQGFDASQHYGENLGNVLGQQAQYGYAGQAGQNARQSNNWSNLFKGLGMVGGGIMGGPFGAAAGNAATNYFFPNKGA